MLSRTTHTVTRTPQADLREYFQQVRDQYPLNSSSAQACVALFEYFERRAFGRMTCLSPLYLHQCAQKLLAKQFESGTDLRTVLKSAVRFGIPEEYHWPYDSAWFNRDPDPFLSRSVRAFESCIYVRLDTPNQTGPDTLETVRRFVLAGYPVAFGMLLPSSISNDATIHYRPTFDSYRQGHAFVVVGFDDRHLHSGRGSLLVRSCWGTDWGDNGYGWLPYGYVENQVAVDFWTLLHADWLESGEFDCPLI
ncbi:MAG: C1 family peptidase [Planctomycetales bacterium]|nr:C1 family peptidase [Planctomycetales bacterium]